MLSNLSNWKEYLKSALLTFIATFAITLLPILNSGDNWKQSALIAAVITAGRAAVKAVLEMLTVINPTTTTK